MDLCNELCFKIHGQNRGNELVGAIKAATMTVVEHGGRIAGYATQVGLLGDAVASNNELKALIGGSANFSGLGFLLPSRDAEMLR